MIRERGVYIDQALAGFRMGANDRVFHQREFFVQRGRVLAEALGEDAGDIVDRRHLAEARLQIVVKTFIRHHHVREERIAADVRKLDGAQDGAQRGLLAPGDIGMPGVLHATRIGTVDDTKHFTVRLVLRRGRMDLKLAEGAGESDMLRAGDILVAEEDDLVLQQGGAHLFDQRIARCGQVGSDQFCPNGGRHGPGIELGEVPGKL